MSRMGARAVGLILPVVLLVGVPFCASGEIQRSPEPEKPAIWMESDIRLVMQAERVARADAMRKMLEKLYGVRLDAHHTVYDLARDNERVNAALQGTLKGMRELRWVYTPEGICQVEMAVTWETVVEEVRKVLRTYCDGCGTYTHEVQEVNLRSYQTEVTVWGNGAIEGTPAVKHIQALRAAEVDAYKRLAARIMGIRITADTTVRDMAFQSDRIQTAIETVIKGGNFTDYVFEPRVVKVRCEVKLESLVAQLKILHTETKTQHRVTSTQIADLQVSTQEKIIAETGVGIIDNAAPPAPPPTTVVESYREINMIIKQTLEAR